MRHFRGQSLVLFAGFCLLLTLMVMASLSLGHVTRAKMELQVASDAAAYSEAVATARAFNSVALLNRAQVATMVALAGVTSSVSFAGTYRASLNATWYGYVNEFDREYCGAHRTATTSFPREMCTGDQYETIVDCAGAAHGEDAIDRNVCYGDACKVSFEIFGWGTDPNRHGPLPTGPTGVISDFNDNARLELVRDEFDRLRAVWQALDDAAGLQARNVAEEAGQYSGLQAQALGQGAAAFEPFTTRSLGRVNGTTSVPALGISHREMGTAWAGGAIINSIEASMGSRAHGFTSARVDALNTLQTQLNRVLGPSGGAGEVTVTQLTGNSYFASTRTHGARPATSFAAWGDEEARILVDYAGIDRFVVNGHVGASGNNEFRGWVRSTDLQQTEDNHFWCPQDFLAEAEPDPADRHTLPPHAQPPPGQFDPCAGSSCIWPSFYDTNAGAITDPGDVFGQPKLMAGATRDLASDRDPWNLNFSYRARRGGGGERLNFENGHAMQGGDGVLTLPAMQSISSSIAYYHRPGHWREPPNLFNPFWRATLVRANVDDPGLNDFKAAASAANAAAINALQTQGYQGVP